MIINGTLSADFLLGSQQDDVINASDGNDWVFGGLGNDTIDGGSGDDRLNGDYGSDTIDGGSGVDIIDGGYGADILTGGIGNDVFRFGSVTDSGNVITDFERCYISDAVCANAPHASGHWPIRTDTAPYGDRLDLHDLLSGLVGYDGHNAFAGGYVSLVQHNGDTIVHIDSNGSAQGGWQSDLVTLQGTILTEASPQNFIF